MTTQQIVQTALDKWPEVPKEAPIQLNHCYVFLIDQRGLLRGLADTYTVQAQFYNAQEDAYRGDYTHFDVKSVYLVTDRTDIDYIIAAEAVKNDANVGSIGEFADEVMHAWSNKIPGYVRCVGIRSCDKTNTAPPPDVLPAPPESPLLAALKWAGIGAATLGAVYVIWRFFPRRH